jgi:hypothetical protein
VGEDRPCSGSRQCHAINGGITFTCRRLRSRYAWLAPRYQDALGLLAYFGTIQASPCASAPDPLLMPLFRGGPALLEGSLALWATTCLAWSRGLLNGWVAIGINAFMISILHEMVGWRWWENGGLRPSFVYTSCIEWSRVHLWW